MYDQSTVIHLSYHYHKKNYYHHHYHYHNYSGSSLRRSSRRRFAMETAWVAEEVERCEGRNEVFRSVHEQFHHDEKSARGSFIIYVPNIVDVLTKWGRRSSSFPHPFLPEVVKNERDRLPHFRLEIETVRSFIFSSVAPRNHIPPPLPTSFLPPLLVLSRAHCIISN